MGRDEAQGVPPARRHRRQEQDLPAGASDWPSAIGQRESCINELCLGVPRLRPRAGRARVCRTHVHARREAAEEPPFDTVHAAFIEGQPLYANAGFSTKDHIQICVRNPRCIKGHFRPLNENGRPLKFI